LLRRTEESTALDWFVPRFAVHTLQRIGRSVTNRGIAPASARVLRLLWWSVSGLKPLVGDATKLAILAVPRLAAY
jgi:hypothetical protein